MVDVVAVGTVAFDSIRTPFGQVDRALGGTASHFTLAASFFAKPGIVSVVGKDFPKEHRDFFAARNIDTAGLQVADGKTFWWKGFYEYDMNEAHNEAVELNTFGRFVPKLPEQYKTAKFVFLGAIDPVQQGALLKQFKNADLIALDTKDFWINMPDKKQAILDNLDKVDMLLLNEWETRNLFQTPNLVKAAREALKAGPKWVIVKKGEHGALLFSKSSYFFAPGYPLENVVDPTGAGDSFAGGLMGWLAKTRDLAEPNLRKAIVYGSVLASYNAEGFGLDNLKKIQEEHIETRFAAFRRLVHF